MAIQLQQRCTPAEYLAIERRAEEKSEYVNGFIFAMAGASRAHNRIAVNLVCELGVQFRGGPCEVFASDMRLKVSATGLYTYPDVSALCGEAQFEDAELDTLLNPTAIIEVLSESTEAYDRGDKFAHYRRLETLAEYVMIAQDKVRIERFVRRGSEWVLNELTDLGDTLHLTSVGAALSLRAIYERVKILDTEAQASRGVGHRHPAAGGASPDSVAD